MLVKLQTLPWFLAQLHLIFKIARIVCMSAARHRTDHRSCNSYSYSSGGPCQHGCWAAQSRGLNQSAHLEQVLCNVASIAETCTNSPPTWEILHELAGTALAGWQLTLGNTTVAHSRANQTACQHAHRSSCMPAGTVIWQACYLAGVQACLVTCAATRHPCDSKGDNA